MKKNLFFLIYIMLGTTAFSQNYIPIDSVDKKDVFIQKAMLDSSKPVTENLSNDDVFTSVSLNDNGGINLKLEQDICAKFSLEFDSISDIISSSTPGFSMAHASNGLPPYTYLWNTDPVILDSMASFNNPGVYSVTATDNNNCTTTASILINKAAVDSISSLNTDLIARDFKTVLEHVLDKQKLAYIVRFQNTGKTAAINLQILDSLHSSLDINTTNIVSKSHPNLITEVLPNNILKFRFDNIQLPNKSTNLLGSKGYVIFEVDHLPNVPKNIVIENKSEIFFDFTSPTITNSIQNDPLPHLCFDSTYYNNHWLKITNFYSNSDSSYIWATDNSRGFNYTLSSKNDVCSVDSIIEIHITTQDVSILKDPIALLDKPFQDTANILADNLQNISSYNSPKLSTIKVKPINPANKKDITKQKNSVLLGKLNRTYMDTLQTVADADSIVVTTFTTNSLSNIPLASVNNNSGTLSTNYASTINYSGSALEKILALQLLVSVLITVYILMPKNSA